MFSIYVIMCLFVTNQDFYWILNRKAIKNEECINKETERKGKETRERGKKKGGPEGKK